jgi:hypothetical protein
MREQECESGMFSYRSPSGEEFCSKTLKSYEKLTPTNNCCSIKLRFLENSITHTPSSSHHRQVVSRDKQTEGGSLCAITMPSVVSGNETTNGAPDVIN